MTDAGVIKRSLDAPEAFAELYDRHAPAIHRFVARRLGHQAAEDAIAETFLVAFRRRDRYDLSRADARPWLYGIAVNVIGKHRRAEVRMLRALARTEVDPLADVDLERAEFSYEEVAFALGIPIGTVRSRLSRARRRVREELARADRGALEKELSHERA